MTKHRKFPERLILLLLPKIKGSDVYLPLNNQNHFAEKTVIVRLKEMDSGVRFLNRQPSLSSSSLAGSTCPLLCTTIKLTVSKTATTVLCY